MYACVFYLQLSSEQNLTLGWRSIQIQPLVQHQIWFREKLFDGNHHRSQREVPIVGQLKRKSEVERLKSGGKVCCKPNTTVVYHKNVLFAFSYLHNKVFVQWISNQEVKCLVPLGRAGAVRDLHHTMSGKKKKVNCIHNINQSIQQQKQFLTVVLWEVPLKISSAPTLGSFPLFFN